MASWNQTGMEEREKGQFPISIATSRAFEGMFDILDEGKRYKSPPIFGFQEVWINLRTLFRNIDGAIPTDLKGRSRTEDYCETMIDEMASINAILLQYASDRVRAVFYYCTFNNLTRKYPKALFKEATTPKQQVYAANENAAIGLLKIRNEQRYDIRSLDTDIPPQHEIKAMILTHHPIDLLSKRSFVELALVESHTGAIKWYPNWNTKLKKGKELERIPFDRMTVQMFGDSGGMLIPYPSAYQQLLLELSEKYKWTTTTTKDRILFGVQLLHNPKLEVLVKQMYGMIT